MGDEQPGRERGDASDSSAPGREQVPDRFYRALAAAERRRSLRYLLDQGDRSSVRKLATVLADWEATDTESTSTETDHDTVLLELHHRHMPILEAAGLVEYDPDSGAVALEELDDGTRDLLDELVAVNDVQDG